MTKLTSDDGNYQGSQFSTARRILGQAVESGVLLQKSAEPESLVLFRRILRKLSNFWKYTSKQMFYVAV